jgi:hypothetical protein
MEMSNKGGKSKTVPLGDPRLLGILAMCAEDSYDFEFSFREDGVSYSELERANF